MIVNIISRGGIYRYDLCVPIPNSEYIAVLVRSPQEIKLSATYYKKLYAKFFFTILNKYNRSNFVYLCELVNLSTKNY